MNETAVIEVIKFSLERLRQYRHQAEMRGDVTQAYLIQKDREHITKSLECVGLMDRIL